MYEPLWWAGMITSECFRPFLIFAALCAWILIFLIIYSVETSLAISVDSVTEFIDYVLLALYLWNSEIIRMIILFHHNCVLVPSIVLLSVDFHCLQIAMKPANVFNIFATVIVGEVANFAAYAFAPAILVTPLGALSIIIRHDIPQPNLIFLFEFMLWCQLLILMLSLQCCSCTYYFTGKVTYIWNSWLCSLCCGVNNYCLACTSRT